MVRYRIQLVKFIENMSNSEQTDKKMYTVLYFSIFVEKLLSHTLRQIKVMTVDDTIILNNIDPSNWFQIIISEQEVNIEKLNSSHLLAVEFMRRQREDFVNTARLTECNKTKTPATIEKFTLILRLEIQSQLVLPILTLGNLRRLKNIVAFIVANQNQSCDVNLEYRQPKTLQIKRMGDRIAKYLRKLLVLI